MKSLVTVCFWNILFNDLEPNLVKLQSERLSDIAESLRFLPNDSLIGLAEIEGDNGAVLAKKLSRRNHSKVQQHRENDHVGVISEAAHTIESLQINGHSYGVIVNFKGITVAIVHLTFNIKGESLRLKEVKQLLSKLESAKSAVIMGDFNNEWWQRSRRRLSRAGFVSSFNRGPFKRTATSPTSHYRFMYPQPYRSLSRYGFSADDIYVKGLRVVDSGSFLGESDHRGVWATLEKGI